MYIPDLEPRMYFREDVLDRAIAWLGDFVPTEGVLHPSDRRRLHRLAKRASYGDGSQGWHTCELCARAESHGEVAIEHRGIRYVAPVMIVHYVEAHRYRPPEQFIDALRHGQAISRGRGAYLVEDRRRVVNRTSLSLRDRIRLWSLRRR